MPAYSTKNEPPQRPIQEKGTPIPLSSHKTSYFSGLHELAALKQRAALIRKITRFVGAV